MPSSRFRSRRSLCPIAMDCVLLTWLGFGCLQIVICVRNMHRLDIYMLYIYTHINIPHIVWFSMLDEITVSNRWWIFRYSFFFGSTGRNRDGSRFHHQVLKGMPPRTDPAISWFGWAVDHSHDGSKRDWYGIYTDPWILGGGNSNIFWNFTPNLRGNDPILTSIFFKGVVQPPTSEWWIFRVNVGKYTSQPHGSYGIRFYLGAFQ